MLSRLKLVNLFNLYPLCSRNLLISCIIGLTVSLNNCSTDSTSLIDASSTLNVMNPFSINSQITGCACSPLMCSM